MTNNIFFHLFSINDALDRFNKTYKKITRSGLIDHIDNIYVNCVGELKNHNHRTIKNYDKVFSLIGTYDKSEAETMDLLRNFCIDNPDGKTLYLHAKGCWKICNGKTINSIQNPLAIQGWVDCMEYFLIEEYNNCLSILEDYDTCGCFLRTNRKVPPHYSGNFWWARNSYIAQLPRCKRKTRWSPEITFLRPFTSTHKILYTDQYAMYHHVRHRAMYTDSPPLV